MKRALILLALLLNTIPVLGDSFPKCGTCRRDARGRIARSAAVRRAFLRSVPRPARCAGTRCEVDHTIALHCGGSDTVGNLQWLTVAEHRAKTRREISCKN
jgi:5-methylcytosine-specific restriction endonuclease McrA